MAELQPIVVYGATGLTGALVVEALVSRGVAPIVAGRNAAKLEALAARHSIAPDHVVVADPTSASAMARMVERGRALVSCAGPFLEIGEAPLAACATGGIHYADSTGEAPFVQLVQRRYAASAHANGCVLAPAMAFEVAVSDAAATLAADGMGEQVGIEVAYAIRGMATSPGTRASAAMVLARPGLAFEDGELREERIAAHVRRVAFAPPLGVLATASFGSPEVITLPLHVNARSVRVFMANRGAPLVSKLSPAIAPIAKLAQPILRRALERTAAGASSSNARDKTRFQIVVMATSQDGTRRRRVVVRGSDPYRLSGSLLAEASIAMARGDVAATGMAAPVQILGEARILELVCQLPDSSVEVAHE